MKKNVLITIVSLFSLIAVAQPQQRPYEIDPSFIPSLEYMQKSWTGEYDGLEPNSRMIISIKRALTLNTDLTYSTEVRGQIKNESEDVLLKSETGTYQYDSETQLVTYTIATDSVLDMNNYLQGQYDSYVVNQYKEDGTEKTSTEKAQFTRAPNDADRQWVLFDQQLMSPIDPRQKAVYVMTGEELEPTTVSPLPLKVPGNNSYYDLNGRKTKLPNHGIYITNGRKSIQPPQR